MQATPKDWIRYLILSGLLILICAWPNQWLRRKTTAQYAEFVNKIAWVDAEFGKGGRAQLIPGIESEKGNISQDAAVSLNIDGYKANAKFGVSIRREVYLPFVIALSLVVAATLSWKRKLWALCAAAILSILVSTLFIEATIFWYFSKNAAAYGVYPKEGWVPEFADFLFNYLLVPPSHRFILPIGVAYLAWISARAWPESEEEHPATTSPTDRSS